MIEQILYSWLFQKRFHGLAQMEKYFLLRDEIFPKDDGLLRSSVLNRFGFFVDDEELQSQRRAFLALIHKGIQFSFPGHEFYPPEFAQLNEPPYLFSFLGVPLWLKRRGLAVVGSREAQAASLQWMDENLGELLEQTSVYLVSGGARGIDQKAHALSLLKNKPTIVLLPSGLGNVYPPSLNSWVEPILKAGGVLISEYDYHEPMRKHYFHARNRLISALGVCTLIVQASRRSGTLITGRQAVAQGRPVLVLPSHPTDVGAQGGLDLLIEGATPIRDARDLQIILDSEFLGLQQMFRRVVDQSASFP